MLLKARTENTQVEHSPEWLWNIISNSATVVDMCGKNNNHPISKKLCSIQHDPSPIVCIFKRCLLRFCLRKETEVEGSSIWSILLILFHMELYRTVYKAFARWRGYMARVPLFRSLDFLSLLSETSYMLKRVQNMKVRNNFWWIILIYKDLWWYQNHSYP